MAQRSLRVPMGGVSTSGGSATERMTVATCRMKTALAVSAVLTVYLAHCYGRCGYYCRMWLR